MRRVTARVRCGGPSAGTEWKYDALRRPGMRDIRLRDTVSRYVQRWRKSCLVGVRTTVYLYSTYYFYLYSLYSAHDNCAVLPTQVKTRVQGPATAERRRFHHRHDLERKMDGTAKDTDYYTLQTHEVCIPSMHYYSCTLLTELKLRVEEIDQPPTHAVRGRRERP